MYALAMIIDDSPLERFLGEILIKNSGFAREVISFNSPIDALTYFAQPETGGHVLPDVIFVDIYMPMMNGFGFLDEYLKLPQAVQEYCKVVMISSTRSPEDYAEMKKYPAIRAFLSKPLSEGALRGLVL